MIVQCEQCQTRFKIPDEKVTEKGVKVRCTKCQNTFRVAREPAPALSAPPPAAPPAVQADPFQAFGDAPEPTGEVTRPGPAYYAPGAPAVKTPVKTWGDVDVDIDVDTGGATMPFDPPASSPGIAARRQAAPPSTPLPSPTNLAGLDLEDPFADFMSDAPAPAAPVAPPRPVASPASGTFRAVPPGAFAPPAARAAPPGAFAAGPSGAARPAAVAPAGAAPLGGPSAPGSRPAAVAPGAGGARPPAVVDLGSDFGSVDDPSFLGLDDFGGTDSPGLGLEAASAPPGARAGAPPAAPGVPAAAPARAPIQPTPGAAPARAAMSATPGAPGAGGAARAGMPPAAGGIAASARPGSPGGPAAAARPGAAPVASPGLAAGSTAPAPDPLFDFSLDAPAAPDAVSLRHAANVAVAPSPSGATAVGPVVPSPSTGFESDDPFASIDVAAPAPDLAAAPMDTGAAPEPMGDLFDFSGAGASAEEGMAPTDTGRAALLGDVPAEAGADEPGGISLLGDVPAYDDGDPFKITTPRREVVDLANMRGGPAVTVAKPSARIEDVGMPQRRLPGRARKVTGLVLNLAIATVLVVALGALGTVYLRDGKVDPSTLSPDRLRTLVMPASRPFVASDVSNGLYETRDGRMLFVVRGEAENRTGAAAAVRVKAALFDGDQRVRSAEGLAGALATPEELHAVTTREAATALRQRMDAAALPVPPGGKVPFLVMFQEFPADLAGFRLEVTLEPVPTEPTADRTGG
ncbi:zinc-ribbon domain-containing protein [Corallococcus macrosporus]|uniref:Zinc-ribbon domain-containing protein n=1 Tax=Corallococcus macrosporus TaxID=35 RepID=A0ABS3D3F2_9BACT|nr:zinc-ribbon domain-containing protein [Corallococcus macrosporus]MBN8226175.1 zinc-ribbon domain-containing protein [Corallococcus macrosporus]